MAFSQAAFQGGRDAKGKNGLSKETSAMLGQMMKGSKLSRRQQQAIVKGATDGTGLPDAPGKLAQRGDQRDAMAAHMHNQQDWAGRASARPQNKYTHARGNYSDLDEFTDWRHVQLPAQRKSQHQIMRAQPCHPSGRPMREAYRPMPSVRPTGEQQKARLQQVMMLGDAKSANSVLNARPVKPTVHVQQQPIPKDSMDEFVGVMGEIQERQVWLTEMKQLGAIDKDSVAKVQAEIQQRLSQAKLLDKGLDQKLAGAHPAAPAAAAAGGGVGSLGR